MSQLPSNVPRMLFFGCWGRAGHFMWTKGRHEPSDAELEQWGYPTPHVLDGSRLLLPYPEKVGQGQRTYLPALHLTVLSWWSSGVFDNRGAVNSHYMFKGRNGTELMWDAFCHNFADLSSHHTKPTIVELY